MSNSVIADHAAPLSELERDALGELSNIAMARAAYSLSQMVNSEIVLSVPIVEVMSREAATMAIEKGGSSRLVAVRQDFTGAFAGRAMLIFPELSSIELVRAVIGKETSIEDIIDLEDESLAETGNIILNCWVATIANFLKRSLKMASPVVIRRERHLIFVTPGSQEPQILFLHIKFEIHKKEIHGYVALLMDFPSIDELRSLIADFVIRVIEKSERASPIV